METRAVENFLPLKYKLFWSTFRNWCSICAV